MVPLTSTLARALLMQSPKHAWTASRDLNPDYRDVSREDFELGTAAHSWLLEGRTDRWVVIDAPDWKSKAAQVQRAGARMAGKIPLLTSQYAHLVEACKAALMQTALFEDRPVPLAFGDAEATLTWEEDGVPCKARLDWLHHGQQTIDDLKTTSGSAHPDSWSRNIWSRGYDVQAAFYLRGVLAVYNRRATFRFIVMELSPPYGVSVIGLEPEALEIADRKIDRALKLWKFYQSPEWHGKSWPCYPTRVAYAEMPAWERAQWEAAEYAAREPEEPAPDDDTPIGDILWGTRA